jgi:hypothetical protein
MQSASPTYQQYVINHHVAHSVYGTLKYLLMKNIKLMIGQFARVCYNLQVSHVYISGDGLLSLTCHKNSQWLFMQFINSKSWPS